MLSKTFTDFSQSHPSPGVSGDLVKFNEHGDSLGRYDIYQYQRSGKDEWAYVKVGEWVDRSVTSVKGQECQVVITNRI